MYISAPWDSAKNQGSIEGLPNYDILEFFLTALSLLAGRSGWLFSSPPPSPFLSLPGDEKN